MPKNHIFKSILVGAAVVLAGLTAKAVSVEIEERERMLSEKVVKVGMCSSEGVVAGRAYIPNHVLRVTYQRTYEKYLVEVTSDGWFGDRHEIVVENSQRQESRREVVNHTYSNSRDCQYWEESHREMLEESGPQ